MCFVGAMLVLSLAACTPTPVKQSESATEPMVEASTGGASDKVPDPNVEPMEIISVYSSNEDATGLNLIVVIWILKFRLYHYFMII